MLDNVLLLFSLIVMSDSLRPPGLQRARHPCLSLSLGVCSNSCPLSWWCHPTSSSSVVPFSSCPQSFPASGSFPKSRLFTSGGQSIGASASAPVLPVNVQGWFPWTGLITCTEHFVQRPLLKPSSFHFLFRKHSVIICILEVRKLRYWEVNRLAWGLTARKQVEWTQYSQEKTCFCFASFLSGSSFGWQLLLCLQPTLVQILAILQMSDFDFSTLFFNAYISEMGFIVTPKSPED